MLSKRTGLASAALTAGLAVTLAACGGGNDAGTGGTTDTSSSSGSQKVAKGGVLKVLGEQDNPTVDTADAYDTN